MLISAFFQHETVDYWFNHQFAAVDQLNCLESKHETYFKTCEALKGAYKAFTERVTTDQHQQNWITYDEIYSKFSKMKGPYVDYVIGLNEK